MHTVGRDGDVHLQPQARPADRDRGTCRHARVSFATDEAIVSSHYRIERIRTQIASELPAAITA